MFRTDKPSFFRGFNVVIFYLVLRSLIDEAEGEIWARLFKRWAVLSTG